MEPMIAASAGVLAFDPPVDVHGILTDVVARLQAEGISVGGLLQRPGRGRTMWAEEIGSDRTVRLDRPRGNGARGCVLDTEALAEASSWLREAIAQRPQVVVFNRFARAEMKGEGLRDEIAEAVVSGSVVIIPVRSANLPDLFAFLGGEAVRLPASAGDISTWAMAAARATA